MPTTSSAVPVSVRQTVCAGYSAAFKLLCDRKSIPCVIVSGKATAGAGQSVGSDGGHAWNYVQMDDGKWYAVDATWNDPVSSDASIRYLETSGLENETYLLVGSGTAVGSTTFGSNHTSDGVWSSGGSIVFPYPALSAAAFVPGAKPSITPTVSLAGWTYGETANTPSVTGNTGSGTVTYAYALTGGDYSATVPSAAGSYTVRATVAETAGYQGGEATASFTIAKRPVTIKAADQSVQVTGAIVNSVEKASVSAGSLAAGDALAGITLTGSSTAAKGTGTITPSAARIQKGSTDVTSNYTVSYENGVLTVTSPPAKVTTAPTAAANLVYSGAAQALLTTRGAAETSMQYKLGDGDWSSTIPSAAAAGSYTVTYRAAAAENGSFSAGTETALTVEIAAKPVTVSGITAKNKAYDGTTAAELVTGEAEFDGKVGSDKLSVTGTGAFADANAGDSFGANESVTREQIAVMVYNYAQYKGYDTSASGNISQFKDSGSTAAWAQTALGWAVGEGLINGTTDANGNVVLDPQGHATRAQVAAILERFCDSVVS